MREQVGQGPASKEPHDGRGDFRAEQRRVSGLDRPFLDFGNPENGGHQLDHRVAGLVACGERLLEVRMEI